MARLTPLVPLFSPSEQLEVSAVAEKLESWLRGNTVPVGHEWHGVREVKAGQMGTATWELCRLIRNKVSVSASLLQQYRLISVDIQNRSSMMPNVFDMR